MASSLQHHREQQHLTQLELAKKAGVSVRTIQRVEAGSPLKGHTLKVLSEALGISPQALTAPATEPTSIDITFVKYVNLAALSFIIPCMNILLPLGLMWYYKQVNRMNKQIVTLQILWTLITLVLLVASPFLKRMLGLENFLVLTVVGIASLVNLFLILRNAISLDQSENLRIKLSFSLL